ncbi:hypothetical protein L1049_021099 [Liquidambar formosana]|uniref:Uncharacterized protein n=1 Tax=Liquidambar formosana TaxID=63359 RepID=A0AAP0SAX8_LIQFO
MVVDCEKLVMEKKSEYESLEAKFRALEVEKLAMEDKVKVLKRRNDELESRIAQIEDENKVGSRREKAVERVDLTLENEEEDKLQLTIENRVLEREKRRAEDEVEIWKVKFRELESRVVQLEDNLILRGGQSSLGGKREEELRLPDMGSQGIETKRTIKLSKTKDGLYVGISSDHAQAKEKTVDLETIHASPSKGIRHLQAAAGTLSIDTPCKHSVHVKRGNIGTHLETKVVYGGRVRKQLEYGDEGSPNKKMAPSTPGGATSTSVGVIDVSDSDDDEPDITHIHVPSPETYGSKMVCVATDSALGGAVGYEKGRTFENSLKRTLSDQIDEEDMSGCKGNLPFSTTPKRKRPSNMITSDSESDDDDKVPICKLKRPTLQESIHDPTDPHLNSSPTASVSGANVLPESVTPRRRRLVTLRQCEETGGAERNSSSNLKTSETTCDPGIPTTDDEMAEVGSDSEGESLAGFIVDTDVSDVSDGDGTTSESEDASDGNEDFGEILSKIRRNRDQKSKWEFEADMLAAFGKDPELCMKAVCALYRQQTTDEKSIKYTIHLNQRGFSQCDAPRGTALAEFLTDGDPKGDLKKSVKELQEYNPHALELCRTLATHYSKQLFTIYNNKEDPYFLPSYHGLP